MAGRFFFEPSGFGTCGLRRWQGRGWQARYPPDCGRQRSRQPCAAIDDEKSGDDGGHRQAV